MSVITGNQALKIPYLAAGAGVGYGLPTFSLLGGGGVTGAWASGRFFNQNISQIQIRASSWSTNAPTQLRASILYYPFTTAPAQSFPYGFCDIFLPNSAILPSVRREFFINFLTTQTVSSAPLNSVDGVLYNDAAINGLVDANGAVVPNIISGSIMSASCVGVIPGNFRVILQNMDAASPINFNTLEIFFVN